MAQRPTIKQPKALDPAQGNMVRMPAGSASAEGASGGVSGAHVLDNLQAEISTEAAPLWNFVMSHAWAIAVGVVGLVVLMGAVAGWQWRVESAAAAARTELGRIISRQDPATRLAELETFAPAAPESVALAAHMELAAAAVQAEAWDKAVEAYSRVADLDKDGALGLVARLNRADVYLRQGKAAEAVADLDAMLPGLDDELQLVLSSHIAEAAEMAGDKQRAIEAYERLLAELEPDSDASGEVLSNPGNADEANYYKARIAALQ